METENKANGLDVINFDDYYPDQMTYAKSGDGWLWISGITGSSPNPAEAITEALEKLKCRYAERILIIINNF